MRTATFFLLAFSIFTGTLRAEPETQEKFSTLFNSQLQTLRARGVPDEIMRLLNIQRESVLKKADRIQFQKNHIPFLPIIPLHFRGIHDSMAAIRNGSKTGYTY